MNREDKQIQETLRRVAGVLEAVASLLTAVGADELETPIVRVEPLEPSAATTEPSGDPIASYCDAPTRRVAVSDELLASMGRPRSAGIVEVNPVTQAKQVDCVPRAVPVAGSDPSRRD